MPTKSKSPITTKGAGEKPLVERRLHTGTCSAERGESVGHSCSDSHSFAACSLVSAKTTSVFDFISDEGFRSSLECDHAEMTRSCSKI